MKPSLITLALFSLFFAACSVSQETSTPISEATMTPEPSPTATPVPVEPVTFITEDGVTLAGTLFGKGKIAVILAHQGTPGADQTSWQPFARLLAERGYTALAFDFRGFGQSGGPGRIGQLDDDIRAAAKYLRSQNYDRIVCAGSCMGGTACLRAAIDGEPFIGLIILASPFDASGGLVVNLKELEQLTQPKLFITGNQDVYGIAWDIKRMYEFSTEPRKLLTFEQSAHGTNLFQTASRDELIDAILNFLISLR